MKVIRVLFIILLFACSAFADNKVIVKANILRGESFVTVDANPKDIEGILNKSFSEKGYQIVSSTLANEEMFFVDLFVFQFPGDYPTITMTIRSKNGIHYIDKENIKLFSDRKLANLKVAKVLAERMPKDINMNQIFAPTLKDILTTSRVSLIGLTSNAITKAYRADYSSPKNLEGNDKPKFIFPNEFDQYAAFAINYQGIRKQLKGTEIKLQLKINDGGKLELVDMVAPFELTEKQKERIQEFVDAFPLWIVENEIDNLEIRFGIS